MRTKNPDNVYVLTCKVTQKSVKTNPKQFFATAARANVSDEVLKTSYISRDGRRIIKDAKLTAEQVVAQYGVDPTYAASLKNLAKPAPAASTENISVEVTVESVAPAAEATPAETAAESAPEASAEPAPVAEAEAVAA